MAAVERFNAVWVTFLDRRTIVDPRRVGIERSIVRLERLGLASVGKVLENWSKSSLLKAVVQAEVSGVGRVQNSNAEIVLNHFAEWARRITQSVTQIKRYRTADIVDSTDNFPYQNLKRD